MKNRKIIALMLGTVLSLGLLVTGCTGNKEPSQKLDSQQTESGSGNKNSEFGVLKSFEAKMIDGGTFTEKDLAAKDVTVINCWSVYCGSCVDEMPEIAKFAASLPDNVQLITLCLDEESELQYAKDILKEADFKGTTILIGNGDLEKVCNKILYTPTTLFVDKDGNIIGDAVIGGQEDLAKTFTASVNTVLKSMGKTEMEVK